jgi:hypothetical protein
VVASGTRAATEPVLQGGVQFGRQFGDPGFELLVLDKEFPHHRLERGNVGRQRGIGGRGGVHAL